MGLLLENRWKSCRLAAACLQCHLQIHMPISLITANIARPRVVSVNAVIFKGLSCTYLVLGIVVQLLHDAVKGVSFYGSVALVKNEQI